MNRHVIVALVLVALVVIAGPASAAKKAPAKVPESLKFTPLFDGKTLEGWHAMPGGKWAVKDGAILGTSVRSERRHGLLVSDKQYSDFVVRATFRVIKGDSGFYFRSEKVKSNVGVNGFQAEIDNSKEVCGLYETGGRGWTVRPKPETIKTIYKPGEWNQLSITACGRNVTVRLNGTVTAQLTNDKGRTRGHFALQLHGGQDMEVMFKDIEIREPTAFEVSAGDDEGFQAMFNGKDLTGWQTTGNWLVKPGNIVTLVPRPGEHGWKRYDAYLTTVRKYKDFIIDLEFKFKARGNSGVFLRVDDRKSQVNTGFEVQILDTHGKKNVGHHDCGGVIQTVGASKNMVKPAGQWNRYRISVIGTHLQVILNGEQIIDIDLSKTSRKDRPLTGYIGFQDEAKFIWYRNVRIKEVSGKESRLTPSD